MIQDVGSLDLRGTLSRLLRQMGPTSRLLFLNEKAKWPHQTVHYHNKKAIKNGEKFRWTASRDLVGRWFIRRCDPEAIDAQASARLRGKMNPHLGIKGECIVEDMSQEVLEAEAYKES